MSQSGYEMIAKCPITVRCPERTEFELHWNSIRTRRTCSCLSCCSSLRRADPVAATMTGSTVTVGRHEPVRWDHIREVRPNRPPVPAG
jgi:hypothetical protein